MVVKPKTGGATNSQNTWSSHQRLVARKTPSSLACRARAQKLALLSDKPERHVGLRTCYYFATILLNVIVCHLLGVKCAPCCHVTRHTEQNTASSPPVLPQQRKSVLCSRKPPVLACKVSRQKVSHLAVTCLRSGQRPNTRLHIMGGSECQAQHRRPDDSATSAFIADS